MFSVGWDRGKPCPNKDRTLVKELFRSKQFNQIMEKIEKKSFIMCNVLVSSYNTQETMSEIFEVIILEFK